VSDLAPQYPHYAVSVLDDMTVTERDGTIVWTGSMLRVATSVREHELVAFAQVPDIVDAHSSEARDFALPRALSQLAWKVARERGIGGES
jgi:hypothetical protein